MQKRITPAQTDDEYGRPIADDDSEEWTEVCKCRCDEVTETKLQLPDGTFIQADFHVVCEGNNPDIATGDFVRCLREDGSVRGCGRIIKPKRLNYLPYAEVYLQD